MDSNFQINTTKLYLMLLRMLKFYTWVKIPIFRLHFYECDLFRKIASEFPSAPKVIVKYYFDQLAHVLLSENIVRMIVLNLKHLVSLTFR